MYQQRYLITGGSGFIGTELIKQLLVENHDVTVLTRNEIKTAQHFEAEKIAKLGIRTSYLRTGIVLGKNGGELTKMLPPLKMKWSKVSSMEQRQYQSPIKSFLKP